jgi:uncharacterized protein YhfF
MWRAYVAANPSVTGTYDVVAFGDSAELADRLAELVVSGPKRATAGALRDFEIGDEPLPKVGGHVVLTDGGKRPVAIWRTTDVEVTPLDEVTESFAWDEGEGDRSLAYWMDAHRRFFRRSAAANGWTYHDKVMTVCERFTVVWPPEAADPV